MPETQSIENASASKSQDRAVSETTRQWVEARISYLKGATTSNNNHARVKERLVELRKLRDGWLEGKGKAPSENALDTVERVFDIHLSGVKESPRVYPTPEGGVQLEWFFKERHYITVRIPRTGTVEVGTVDIQTGKDTTRSLDHRSPSEWTELAKVIERYG